MNVLAKFDEIRSMILQDIKETKRYRHTDGRLFVWSDNVKTVYPPTNKVCGGYNKGFDKTEWMSADLGLCFCITVCKNSLCFCITVCKKSLSHEDSHLEILMFLQHAMC